MANFFGGALPFGAISCFFWGRLTLFLAMHQGQSPNSGSKSVLIPGIHASEAIQGASKAGARGIELE